MDKPKQIRAFMPNLIHSLDACSLALLVDQYFHESDNSRNIYTVHDCFGVTCNNISELISLIKDVYIKLYSDPTYIRRIDETIKRSIVEVYGEDSFNPETLTITVEGVEGLKFPDVEKILDEKFEFKKIKDSKYILN